LRHPAVRSLGYAAGYASEGITVSWSILPLHCLVRFGLAVPLWLLFPQHFEYKAVETVFLRHVFPAQLSVTVPAELYLPRISPKPGIPVRDPLDAHTPRGIAITAQPDNVAVIGKVMMVAAANVNLFRHPGDRMAAGGANESPFIQALTVLTPKERRLAAEVVQVIHVLSGGIGPWRCFGDEGGRFMLFKIFCHGR
jgi:hypothetical protein